MQEKQFKMASINNKGTISNFAQRDINIGTPLTPGTLNTPLMPNRGPDEQLLSRQVAAIATCTSREGLKICRRVRASANSSPT
jgi:hypothetical protein